MKSQLVDRFGNKIVSKSSSAPNLDPDFWIPDNQTAVSIGDTLNKPYIYNHWIFACVRVIAQNVAQIERNLKRKNDDSVDDNHKVMALLDKPNLFMDYYTFFYTIVCHLMLPSKRGNPQSGGQCFIVPWDTFNDQKIRLDKGDVPDDLMPFSSAFFEPWYTDTNNRGLKNLRGWTFKLPNLPQSKINFEFGEIIMISTPNPYDFLRGISPFSAIASVIESDTNADIFNNNLFQKQGRLDGQVTSDQYIDKSELDKIEEEWHKQYSGPNQRRVAFLSGGLKYEQYGLSSMDLGYIDQSKWNRQKILASYGLNRIAIGDYENINLATMREGRKNLWYDRYIPLDRLILSGFNGQWIKNIDKEGRRLSSDYSKIQALQTDMKERAQVGGILCKQMDFPPELAARIVDIKIKEEDLKRWPHLSEKVSSTDSQFGEQSLSVKSVDLRQTDYSVQYIKSTLEPIERKFKPALDKYFVRQRNLVLDKIDELVKDEKSIIIKISVAGGWQFLPDEAEEVFKLLGMYKEASKVQMALEKKQVERELRHNVEWDTSTTRLDYWVSLRSKGMRDIVTGTFIHVRNAIDATVKDGLSEGITVNEMRSRIKDAVHDVYDVRLGKPVQSNGLFDLGAMSSSKTVARTEMGSIATLTRADIFKTEGIEKIEWITAHDEKVRVTHSGCEDEGPISYGAAFKSNGLRYPRDPNGSAGEVINCRCSFVAVIED